MAIGYAATGDHDRAEAWLERTVAEREGGIVSLRCNLAFDGMRSEPRFRRLMKSIRLE